jgi:hypothetical protein
MGRGVTTRSHSRSVALAVVLPFAMLLAGCLEPLPVLDTGTTPGKAKLAGCSPLNCTGCCAGERCLGGNTDDACGYDGRGCNTCPNTHRCESPGACYPIDMPRASTYEPIPDDAVCYQIDQTIRCQ